MSGVTATVSQGTPVIWHRYAVLQCCFSLTESSFLFQFLADRTNGRAYATVLRLSVVVCDVMYCG